MTSDAALRLLTVASDQLNGPVQRAINGSAGMSQILRCTAGVMGSVIAEEEAKAENGPARRNQLEDLVRGTDDWISNPATFDAVLGLVATDQSFWNRVVDRTDALVRGSGDSPAGGQTFSTDDRAQLLVFLQNRCGEASDIAVTGAVVVAGGYSKQTVIVELANNAVVPSRIVLRRDRPESPVEGSVTQEFALLRLLHQAGLRVPRPLAVHDGDGSGPAFIAMEAAGGINIGDVYDIGDPKNVGPHIATQLAQELAKLHAIPLSEVPQHLPGRNTSHREFIRAEVDAFKRAWYELDTESVVLSVAFEWLDAHLDQLGDDRCLTHGDCRFHNILSHPDEITALLDWELAAVSHPARDLGYVKHHIEQFADWEAFVETYRRAGGKVPRQVEIDFYSLWSDVFVAVYQFRALTGLVSGQTDSIEIAYAGQRMRQQTMRMLSDRLSKILRTDRVDDAEATRA